MQKLRSSELFLLPTVFRFFEDGELWFVRWVLRGLPTSKKCSTGFGAGNCPKKMCEAHHTPVALRLV